MTAFRCPDCEKACLSLECPHGSHHGKLPCGHPGVINCKNKAVEVCHTCGRDDRPSKEPRHNYVPTKSS